MRNAQRKHHGVTLLEVILVLTVASSILILSIQQYLAFRNQADVEQLETTVDTLFRAMTNFYRANCNSTSVTVGTNTINFGVNGSGASVAAIPMSALTSGSYLEDTIPINPLVDYTVANPYVLQFNQLIDVESAVSPARITLSSPSSTAVQTGSIIIWQIQVAVAIKNTAAAQQYLNLMNGDCLSASVTGLGGVTEVTPCSSLFSNGASNTNYIVFQRLPSNPSANGLTPFWVTLPTVTQFTQMYNTYNISYLLDPAQNAVKNQLFMCGS